MFKGKKMIMGLMQNLTAATLNLVNTVLTEHEKHRTKLTKAYMFRSKSQPHEWVLCDIKTQEKLAVNPDFEFQELVLR